MPLIITLLLRQRDILCVYVVTIVLKLMYACCIIHLISGTNSHSYIVVKYGSASTYITLRCGVIGNVPSSG